MKIWTVVILLTIIYLNYTNCADDSTEYKQRGLMPKKYEKRPFCNAFTGCGRKRNVIPPQGEGNMRTAEALTDLIDMIFEPAVDNIEQQVKLRKLEMKSYTKTVKKDPQLQPAGKLSALFQ